MTIDPLDLDPARDFDDPDRGIWVRDAFATFDEDDREVLRTSSSTRRRRTPDAA